METAERSKEREEPPVFAKTVAVTCDDIVLQPANALRDADIFDAITQHPTSRTDCISALLSAAYEVSPEVSAEMPILERHAGLFRLAVSFGSWPAWFVGECEKCSEFLDVRIASDEFEYNPAAVSKNFPYFEVTVGAQTERFMVPNGTHESYLEKNDGNDPVQILSLCQEAESSLDPAIWSAPFEKELTKYSPAVTTELRFACPKCKKQTGYWFDPLDWISRHAAGCLFEVHELALAYGWQEQHILAMSTARRKTYLKMLTDDSLTGTI